MKEFLGTRAGHQLLGVVCCGLFIWIVCQLVRGHLLYFVGIVSADDAYIIVTSVMVGGSASFIYSVLRVLDMRTEMIARRRAFESADYIATHDNLTRLPNRYGFERHLLSVQTGDEEPSAADEKPDTTTVFSIDLDGFKKVNDLLGHQAGDTLLKEIARRISLLADYECVFRFGGDEFVVVAQGMPLAREEMFAKLLIHSISRPVQIGTHQAEVGAAVGYARIPCHGKALKEVCHHSDVALYEAKARGRNQFSAFHPGMLEKVSARARLERELRRAIEESKIEPFFQPLIDLKTGRLCGFEALARWQREDQTFVAPDKFIPVAEETGLITELFEQLLRKACRYAVSWPDHLTLSFNVSPIQIEDRLLVSRILRIIDETRLPASQLEIEITENALIGDPDLAATTLQQLHAAGVQIALDDFGTGYSSLSQLARFQFDKIKIDKSFVSASLANDKNAKIVDAIFSLSRSLNLKTTVEGIEENRQLAYFLGQGCDIAQGYLFGKAMPGPDVVLFLSQFDEARQKA